MKPKHTMQKQNEVKLGALAPSGAGRDAIHIAVVPVTSDQTLHAGDHVRLVKGSSDKVVKAEDSIGIVDPFLIRSVLPGQKFWLCLHPYTITSLAHVWTHPSFPEVQPKPKPMPESEAYLRKFADKFYYGDYDGMLARIQEDNGACFNDDDGPYEAREPEFQKHLANVLGWTPEAIEELAFRCAC